MTTMEDYLIMRVLSEGTLRPEDLYEALCEGLDYLAFHAKAISVEDMDYWIDVLSETPLHSDEFHDTWADLNDWLAQFGYSIEASEYDPAVTQLVAWPTAY